MTKDTRRYGPAAAPDDDGERAFTDALCALDPATREPGYWFRFHRGVMAAAADELARRRMMADVTMSELVSSWGRTLVPTAVLAAAAAAILLLQAGEPSIEVPDPVPVAFEEVLTEGLEALGPPVVEDETGGTVFASQSF